MILIRCLNKSGARFNERYGIFPGEAIAFPSVLLAIDGEMPMSNENNEFHNAAHLSHITLNLQKPLSIFVPTLYRYLPKQYVESFFDTGSFRVSCFRQFYKHTNEQQGDKSEGTAMLLINDKKADLSFGAFAELGQHAYISSFTSRMNKLDKVFGDAVIEIFEPLGFLAEIANELPGSENAMIGPCVYAERRILQSMKGAPDIKSLQDGNGNVVMEKILEVSNSISGPKVYFLKEKKYEDQAEYRMIWENHREVKEPLIVTIHNPQRFCRWIKV